MKMMTTGSSNQLTTVISWPTITSVSRRRSIVADNRGKYSIEMAVKKMPM